MKKLPSLIAVCFAFSVGLSPVAHAADSAAATTQQSKMSACNKEAEGKKGDERKAFMKTCLSAKPAAAAETGKKMTQQEKMKSCNTEAAGKKGDERKVFMSECLKK